jgi:LysM repeat protein/ABC-type branched-subunit amino acid transport system substrate-binding protein
MKFRFLSIIISFLLFSAALYSQDVVKSTVIEKVDGKDYYIHTVKKGESLWKIASAYSVTTDDITSNNPDSKKKIKPGQKLKIPVKSGQNSSTVTMTNHVVEKGESLYSIAKSNSVTVEDIAKANPGISDNIKPGQTILIPVKNAAGIKNKTNSDSTSADNNSANYNCNNPKLLDSYNIALMIPFYLNDISAINPDDPDIKEKAASDFTSFTYVQYYEGILLAIDSLKKKGFSAKVYVYDVDEDSAATAAILAKPEFAKMHLIIGPFFEGSMRVVARFAQKHNIKVVDPVSTDDAILKGNPTLFEVSPSISMQLKQLAAWIVGRYPSSPVIVVDNNLENEKEYVSIFKAALKAQLKLAGIKDTASNEVIYNQSGLSGITRYFRNADTNIVVTLSNNGELFVTNYVSKLDEIYDKYKMIVIGLPGWKNYDNVETEYLQNINLHMFSSSFIDYTNDNVKNFIYAFRDQYKTEPDKCAFQGYDVGMFFFNALNSYGLNFDKCIDKVVGSNLQSNYKFVKTGSKDGFDNSYLNIYRYEDYRLLDVRTHPHIKEKEKDKDKKKK